ncbi:RING-H2 finger protein ATL38-like [Momordica charantia]|uniref:RING-H2 finger protein ATL38-like n=1 Tax=Momordica charantia TaxID=3673 RepID=A0A6J1BZK6_MOMCH|nr:RING-H2 finger protein ATL38-like [Momordica charantia]
MMSSGINLVMTVIGFTVSTLFIVFVCTRLVCARIHLNASRRSFAIASRSDFNGLERGLHGLEAFAVANFPTKKYSDEYFSSMRNAQCTVCLADYHCEDILRILPYCGHSFHVNCIDIWLHQHSTCPVCRVSLREAPDKKRPMQPLFSSAIRSHYTLNSNVCTHPCDGFPLRDLENSGLEPIQENHCSPGANGADSTENASSFVEGNSISKGSRNKNVETSNA